jgi:16S rRNA (cytosine967-C5)-methyltransferase
VTAPTPGRLAALEILRAVRTGGLADRALERATQTMDARERAWTHELVFGILRMRARLDHLLTPHSRRPLAGIDPDILDILRIGAYQLLEMGGVPAYAAVSESVELVRTSAQPAATGFVNAVLQSLRRAPGASTFPALETEPVAHLATWGSHPGWLVERWIAQFGVAATARLVAANNERPELYLRVLGGDVEGARLLLEQHGVVTERVPLHARALRIVEGSVAAALNAAPVIVQDPAAGAVIDYAGPAPRRALDLAAAPGGKTLALAGDRPDADRLVVAADLSRSRLRRLRANVDRVGRPAPEGLGAIGVSLVAADGRHPPFRPAGLVLVDAPCSGTGTLRRHPDGRWRIGPADLAALSALQADLLDAAALCVEPGGLLIYATCSLEPEENELQVMSFLERTPGFAIEAGHGARTLLDAAGMLRVLPQEHGVDGAFAARLRRTS